MNNADTVYTYRGGQKIALTKSADSMVVRGLPGDIDAARAIKTEQVSSASTRITTASSDLEAAMVNSRASAPTHHAYFTAQGNNEFLISDRVFVTFKQLVTDAEVDEFAADYALLQRAAYSERDYLFQLTNHTGMNPLKLVVKLVEEDGRVEQAEHDLNQRTTTYAPTPADPEYVRQWHLHSDFHHPDYDARASVRCDEAWNLMHSVGSSDVVIAVTDDGCKLDHVDFDSGAKFASWGYLRGTRLVVASDIDADPGQMYLAGANHGTSCCGVIGGEIDAMSTVGAAPGCQLLPIQWESSGPSLYISDSKLLTVLNYIADKADVMSNSWGSSPVSVWALPVLNRIRTLSQTGGRQGRGIVFLWAAGNENCPISHSSHQEIPYDNGVVQQGGSLVWVGVNTAREFSHNLTDIPGVMHIAALASTARRSHYSNYGSGISLCAPSSNSHTYYRMSVRGLGVTTTTGNVGGVTHGFGGTSSATPLTAAIAGLVLSANPLLSAADVIAILKQTASKDLNFDPYPKTAPASFDSNTAWDVSPVPPFDSGQFQQNGDAEGSWSPWFGFGKVDAHAAVAEALARRSQQGAVTFNGEVAPNRSIPDNNATGIKSRIRCEQVFRLSRVSVRLDLSHSYIGDLVITLIAPSGARAVLHQRNGGSNNDLHRDYDMTSSPALAVLLGDLSEGEWTLHVQDLAAADRGRLERWQLTLDGSPDRSHSVEEQPGVIIPDNSPQGISRTLPVDKSGQLTDIEVELDITHSYIGDLLIELMAPAGGVVRLHQRSGGSANNIIRTFTLANTAQLEALRGSEIQGDWTLRIVDLAGDDQGKLNRWALVLTN